MNLAHVHLLLNHFPTIGMLIAFGLFAVSLVGKHDDLKRVSLSLFFVLALIAFPTYMSGNAAQEAILGRPDVSEPLMAKHESAALFAFVFILATGVVAWFGLWQFRRNSRPATWTLPAVLVLSLITFGLMANAASVGGEIRHPEIGQATVDAGAPAPVFSRATVQKFIGDNRWVWPISEILHFVGLCFLFSVVFIVNLRMLGFIRNVSFESLHRLLPIGMFGFVINTITGMLFFIGTPEQYTQNVAFYWKMMLVLMAGASVLYFTVFDEPWQVGARDDAPFRTKFIAASTIALWLGVLYFGRMLPYLGNSF
jgi:uncharacterized membrane protein